MRRPWKGRKNLETVLRIILDEPSLTLRSLPQTEREFRKLPGRRSIRVDVWGEAADGYSVYDTEPQRRNTKNLPKRSHYYQSLIDCTLLKPGETDFNRLPKSYIITICPFDLFGRGRYRYTFRACCEEEPDLVLGDEAIRIFLNTRGTNDAQTRKELVDLLHLFEHPEAEVARQSGNTALIHLQREIEEIKESEEVNSKYMQLWEEMEYYAQEVRKELNETSAKLDEAAVELEQEREARIRDQFEMACRYGASCEAAVRNVMEVLKLSEEEAQEKARLYWPEVQEND